MSLPTNPFAFKSGALDSNLPQTNVTISGTGATTSASTTTPNALPSAASMFQAFAQSGATTFSTNDDDKKNNNNTTKTTDTSFQVDTTNITKIAAINTFRDTDNDNDNDTFDVFKAAQDNIDLNLFQNDFGGLNIVNITKKRQEIENEKQAILQESLDALTNGTTTSNNEQDDWLQFLNALDAEIEKVEEKVKQNDEIELQNSIALIGDAIQNKTTISLPSQSAESREFTAHITKLYQEFNEKKKTKEIQRQQNRVVHNNTVGLKPQQGMSARDKVNKNKKAANKAMDRFDRLDAMGTMSDKDRIQQKRRQGNGQIDFLNDDVGPYKKQSQANKKKGKKLNW